MDHIIFCLFSILLIFFLTLHSITFFGFSWKHLIFPFLHSILIVSISILTHSSPSTNYLVWNQQFSDLERVDLSPTFYMPEKHPCFRFMFLIRNFHSLSFLICEIGIIILLHRNIVGIAQGHVLESTWIVYYIKQMLGIINMKTTTGPLKYRRICIISQPKNCSTLFLFFDLYGRCWYIEQKEPNALGSLRARNSRRH